MANTGMLTIAEVAARLRVSKITVRHLIASGSLRALALGGSTRQRLIRITEADLEAAIQRSGTVEVQAPPGMMMPTEQIVLMDPFFRHP